ncbi:MAG: isoamylase early set domain-containing protein [Candidatus Marinimicrobia bacterium]|nr:isoamylase early set domain-containing protein [Candidatus Neomarinimicrobiota bacterium]
MLKKKYLKSKPVCKVTFKLKKSYVGDVDSINLVGDINGWDEKATSLKKLKNGDFTVDLDMETGSEYQFRYRVNHEYWINDDAADKYLPSPFPGIDNSVISI